MPPSAQMTLCSTPGRMNRTSPVTCSLALMTETDPRLPAITQGAGLQCGARCSTSTENTHAGNGRPALDIARLSSARLFNASALATAYSSWRRTQMEDKVVEQQSQR